MTRPSDIGVIDEIVVGSRNPNETAAYLGVFGMQAAGEPAIAKEVAGPLYGLSERSDQILMKVPGVDSFVRIVPTAAKGTIRPFQEGHHGFDFRTRDAHLTARLAAIAKNDLIADPLLWTIEGDTILEARNLSADRSFAIYGVEFEPDTEDILNQDRHRLHSHINLLSSVIQGDEIEEEMRFWTERVGLQVVWDGDLPANEMAHLQQNYPPEPMRSTHLRDGSDQLRLDLLSYPGRAVAERECWPIHSGIHAFVLNVKDLDGSLEAIQLSRFEGPVSGDFGRGSEVRFSGVSPGGLRFELRQAS